MPFLPDLPPSKIPLDSKLVAYLQQLVDNPSNADANPKRLRHLVAFFEDEGPRVYVMPGKAYTDMGWVGGPSDDIPCKILKRSDTALSVIFVEEKAGANAVAGWIYAAGSHGHAT
jgi:hypothetical protein